MKTIKTMFLIRTKWIPLVLVITAVALLICYNAFAQPRHGTGRAGTTNGTGPPSDAQIPDRAALPDENDPKFMKMRREWLEQFYRPRTVSPSDYAKAAAKASTLPASPLLQGRKFRPAAPPPSPDWVFQALSPMWNDWGGLGGSCTIPYQDPDHSYCGASARVEAIAVGPTTGITNPEIVYVGGFGGLYKSTNGGLDWAYLSDGLLSQSFRCIAIDPNSPNIVYAGTGTNNYFGVGIYRSTDSGGTWTLLNNNGEFTMKRVEKIAIDPQTHTTLYASVASGSYGGNHWVWKSTDSGSTWGALPIKGPTGGEGGADFELYDIVIQPPGPSCKDSCVSTVYITAPDGVWRGIGDGNWTSIHCLPPGTPAAQLAFVNVASTPTLYLAYQRCPGADPCSGCDPFSQGLTTILKSTDQGTNWTSLADPCVSYYCQNPPSCSICTTSPSTQPCPAWCAALYCFGVNPSHPNEIFVGGGGDLAYSTDSGSTWMRSGDVHQDMHAIAFSPVNGERNYLGCDGGIYRADVGDIVCTEHPICWYSKNQNLPSSLMQGISISSDDSIVMGNQDNGTQLHTAPSPTPTNPPWMKFYGGDGFRPKIHPTDNSKLYYEPGYGLGTGMGSVTLVVAGQPYGITPSQALNECAYFFPGMYVAPNDFGRVIVGFENVYRKTVYCTDCGNAWTRIGTGPGACGNAINALCESPANSNVIYAVVGFPTETIYVTRNANSSPTPTPSWSPTLVQSGVRAVTAHPTNDQVAYAACDSGVWKTTDQGNTWTNKSGPYSNLIYFDVAIVPDYPDYVFAACYGNPLLGKGGVLVSTNGGGSWDWMSDGIPAGVIVESLSFNSTSRHLAAGTFGRGAYIIDLTILP